MGHAVCVCSSWEWSAVSHTILVVSSQCHSLLLWVQASFSYLGLIETPKTTSSQRRVPEYLKKPNPSNSHHHHDEITLYQGINIRNDTHPKTCPINYRLWWGAAHQCKMLHGIYIQIMTWRTLNYIIEKHNWNQARNNNNTALSETRSCPHQFLIGLCQVYCAIRKPNNITVTMHFQCTTALNKSIILRSLIKQHRRKMLQIGHAFIVVYDGLLWASTILTMHAGLYSWTHSNNNIMMKNKQTNK